MSTTSTELVPTREQILRVIVAQMSRYDVGISELVDFWEELVEEP